MTRLTLRIDRSACRGSGSCAVRAPGTFRLDEERKSTVIEAAGDPQDAIRAAAAACPAFAITLEESER